MPEKEKQGIEDHDHAEPVLRILLILHFTESSPINRTDYLEEFEARES